MHFTRLLFYLIGVVIFQLKVTSSHSQEIDLTGLSSHSWVDSVYESLSITERINQMLVLDIGDNPVIPYDYPTAYGGVLISSSGPVSHGNAVNSIQQNLVLPTLVFSYLDEKFGIEMDSIVNFGSTLVFAAVTEPYLIYETGQAIAKQSRHLGIHGLFSKSGDIFQNENPYHAWKLTEMNQGFEDQGMLPLNFINLYSFKDFILDTLMFQDDLAMLKIHPENVPDFHEIIREGIADEEIDIEVLNKKCRNILAYKFWSGLSENQIVNTDHLNDKLNSAENRLLQQELAQVSLTILKNEQGLLPVKEFKDIKIASVSIGKSSNPVFESFLDNYTQLDHYFVKYEASEAVFSYLRSKLSEYDLIIVGVYTPEFLRENSNEAKNYLIFQEWLNQTGNGISFYFGDPELLNYNQGILNASTLILAYDDNDLYNSLTPQLIFGGIEAEGTLPYTINETFGNNHGISMTYNGRFSYTYPEVVGLNSDCMNKIDSIVYSAINEKAIPGCQVLVARDSKVIFKKSYGYHTYDSLQKVMDKDLYDLASITKVSGALPGLMKLYEEGKFDLDATLGTYLPYFNKGNKKELTFREILAHQSGMIAWIPYWESTIRRNGKYRRKTLSADKSVNYPYKIEEGLFLHKDFKKKIYKQIRKSKVGENKYLYSGLTFYVFPEIIEAITGEKYTDYIYANFYKPLGATTLTYNPLDKFGIEQIVPTEYDSLFRKVQIHGKVHDEGAAMMKGVSSNAGLFANADDLGKLFQMYCNYGVFGGHRYLSEETIREFARCQYPENDNRRGLGFDRPLPEPHENGNTAKSVSQLSFGHSGFTGTYAWVDPEYNLVYIFLSNRVYRTRENRKLYEHNVRTNIQEVIYEAMK